MPDGVGGFSYHSCRRGSADYKLGERTFRHVVCAVGRAPIFNVGLLHIFKHHLLGRIPERHHISGHKPLRVNTERGGHLRGVEGLEYAGTYAECAGPEGDGLKLQTVVAEAVFGEAEIETLHEVGRRALLRSGAGPVSKVARPCEEGEEGVALFGGVYGPVAQRLEVAPRGAEAGEVYELSENVASNRARRIKSPYATVFFKKTPQSVEIVHLSYFMSRYSTWSLSL